MRNPVSPTASDTPDEPTTGAAPGPAAPPRDPIQRGCPFAAPAEYAAMRTDAPEHTRYRRMPLPVFTVRRVRAMRPAAQARVDEILDGMPAAGGPECIGQHLARLELEVALETLIRRAPTLRLAGDRDQVAFKHDSATFGLEELKVTW
ncbi:hypothetical protein ACFWIY_19020 [Streptomyces sioyaensis]|uniref:hypothetical protein n=1 Tax=Streptomyces sioyaensis TaxID=67364 RepID=UPI003666A04C